MSHSFIGIDVGLGGAVAHVACDSLGAAGEIKAIYDLPAIGTPGSAGGRTLNLPALAELFRDLRYETDGQLQVTMERVGPMKNDSRAGAFKFGRTFGGIEGVLAALGIGYRLITPQTWKRYFGLLKAKKTDSIKVALQHYPRAASMFTLVKHHNRAESLLIAEWGRKHAVEATP